MFIKIVLLRKKIANFYIEIFPSEDSVKLEMFWKDNAKKKEN